MGGSGEEVPGLGRILDPHTIYVYIKMGGAKINKIRTLYCDGNKLTLTRRKSDKYIHNIHKPDNEVVLPFPFGQTPRFPFTKAVVIN